VDTERPAPKPSAPTSCLVLAGLFALGTASAAGAGETTYAVTPGPTVRASFKTMENAPVALAFTLDSSASRTSMAEFGYTEAEVHAVYDACAGCDATTVNDRVDQYYRAHGFTPAHLATGTVSLTVDIPGVVRRNSARVKPVAAAIQKLAVENAYGPDQVLGAAVAFVQTAMVYRKPPTTEGGRQTGGFYPPPRALEVGAGDCDTKSALLAAVVANFSAAHMVGVHIPGHYLVGVSRVPRSGEAFVQYKGQPYVLVEASGPNLLPPGVVAPATLSALKASSGVRIDPLF